jgi:hypothetical protein
MNPIKISFHLEFMISMTFLRSESHTDPQSNPDGFDSMLLVSIENVGLPRIQATSARYLLAPL